jgi:hypothetical protein
VKKVKAEAAAEDGDAAPAKKQKRGAPKAVEAAAAPKPKLEEPKKAAPKRAKRAA